MKRIGIGELLLQEQLIDQATLDKAIATQKITGEKLGRVFLSMGVVEEEKFLSVLAKQLKVPFINLITYDVDASLSRFLPEIYARQYRALVVEESEEGLVVGMSDPLDINAIDAITPILKQPFKVAIVSEEALLVVIDRIYRRTAEITHFAKELSSEMSVETSFYKDDLFDESVESEEQAPVVKLLNSIFQDAVQSKASDIHIEPDEQVLRIRLRIDGVLNEQVIDDNRIVTALVQRIKLRANLNIAEKRVPQDGRFNFTIKSKRYDVRVSTLPTSFGESVVMRLLSQEAPVSDLGELGLTKEIGDRLKAICDKPYGMLLVTGPTGSGKTTTLYSLLTRLNTSGRKIITAEDPVEYRVERVNQVQINPKIDLTFANVLRAILRQDPDVILVGEIRDTDTARIAMQAAVTGHFVLATLHTNDAMTSALRLIDMGAEGYMVAAAVKAIIGQRLVRLLCKSCIKDHRPNANEQAWLNSMGVDLHTTFKSAEGCSRCAKRGYAGRQGIYELLELNTDMLNALRMNSPERFAKAAYESESYVPLAKSVLSLVLSGETSINEAMRVAGELEEEYRRTQEMLALIRDEEEYLKDEMRASELYDAQKNKPETELEP